MAAISYKNLSEKLENSLERISLLTHNEHKDLRIEQIEFAENDRIKSCVVSYLLKRDENITFPNLPFVVPPYERIYKEVKFDIDGNIIGLYIFDDK